MAAKKDSPKINDVMDQMGTVRQMKEDGFTASEIATTLGFAEEHIKWLIEEKVDVGTPEAILQENLRYVCSLIPIADLVYRSKPTFSNAQALSNFISTSKSIIDHMNGLREKDVLYKTIIEKCLQATVRTMIKEMMTECKALINAESLDGELRDAALQAFSKNMGSKFQEAYRKATEDLAVIIKVSSEEKARTLAGITAPSIVT